jgi:tetratricopeptide (TPR) repeat protein
VKALTDHGRQLLRERRFDEAVDVWRQLVALRPQASGPVFQLARALHRSGNLEDAAAQYLQVLAIDPQHDKALAALEEIRKRFGLLDLAVDGGAALGFGDVARRSPEALPGLATYEERVSLVDHVTAPSKRLFQLAGSRPKNPPAKIADDQKQESTSVDSLLRRARSAYSQHRLEEAEGISEQVLSLDPDNQNALTLQSGLYLQQKNWVRSSIVLERLDKLQPDSIAIKQNLAQVLVHRGELTAAAAVYEQLARLQPDKKVLEALCRIYTQLQNWHAACTAYARLLERHPSQETRWDYARALKEADRTADTEAQLEAMLAVDPRHSDALTLLGRSRSRSNPEAAFACWQRLAAINPGAVEPPLQMARIRSRQGRNAEAMQFFNAVLTHDPNHSEALAGLGRALGESDRTAAIDHFTRWIERQPQNAIPRLERGRLYQLAHDLARAEEDYRDVLERDPRNQTALSRFAQLLSQDPSRIEHAIELWRGIAEREPASPVPFIQQAGLLERVSRFADAEAAYRAALDRVPGDQDALVGLARLLSNHGKPAEAIDLYQALHRLNPGKADALLELGRCLERSGRDDEALDAFRGVLTLDSGNANALLYRGRLLRQLGRVEEAIGAWREVCATAPHNADAWHELVFMLATAEREQEALEALDAARAALPDTPQSWTRLGLAAQAGKLDQQAVAYFERAIAAEPHEAKHHAQLGLHYRRQGVLDGAFHHLLSSRELNPGNVPVAKHLAETVRNVEDLGIDPVALADGMRRVGEVLVPERLFALIRQKADREVVTYDPVPRRVIAVSSSLAAGGAERQLVTMLRGLCDSRFGLDLALFCISLSSRSRRDFFLPQLRETSVEIVLPETGAVETYLRDPEVRRYARLIEQFPEDMVGPIAFWLREFRRRRPQVVHAWQDGTNLTTAAAALLAGVPRIILCSRSIRPNNPRRTLRRFMQAAYQSVSGHPAIVLTNNSRAGANDHAEWLGLDPSRIEVVYNGIDFSGFRQSADPDETQRARASLGIPPDAPVLGGVFRMSEEKRPLLWVEVAAAVVKDEPSVHFIVCGAGPMRTDMLEQAATLGIGDRLHLPGPQTNIASWYKAMNVVMLTSRYEGLPNVPLEAQALGIPVVVTAGGGMRETVWDGVTGWTVDDSAPAAIAERVLVCLRNQAWSAGAAANGPAFVEERFGVEVMLRRNLQIYGIPLPNGVA